MNIFYIILFYIIYLCVLYSISLHIAYNINYWFHLIYLKNKLGLNLKLITTYNIKNLGLNKYIDETDSEIDLSELSERVSNYEKDFTKSAHSSEEDLPLPGNLTPSDGNSIKLDDFNLRESSESERTNHKIAIR